MDGLLYVWVHSYHLGVQLWMLPHQHFRIPGRSDEDGVNAARDRNSEDVADLQTDQEGIGYHNRGELAVAIVARAGEN